MTKGCVTLDAKDRGLQEQFDHVNAELASNTHDILIVPPAKAEPEKVRGDKTRVSEVR
ncbi:MAG: hypothetical protein LBM69_04230 [Lachnospiraceae bacterium]|jgi:hypothetical protein|nr:hypothetical protein [Lachnospiraceae bacterium]